MNGIHDLGGMHGFGPVIRKSGEPTLEDWELRINSIMYLVIGRGFFNIDAFRYGIEQMDPAAYLATPYYGRWLATVEWNLVQASLLTDAEVTRRMELLRQDPGFQAAVREPVVPAPAAAPEPSPAQPAPRFAAGDAVLARNVHPIGHTRLPRYARGRPGVINRVHGPAIFPDSNAHGLGKNPQVVYNVRFDARDLWGDSAEPRQTVSIDLWESYLEPAAN